MEKLLELRRNINQVDKRLIVLLNERARLASQVARLKQGNKIKIFSPEREAAIIRKIKELKPNFLKNKDIEIIFREIISVCRALRITLNVAYSGERGTFTRSEEHTSELQSH